MKNILKLLLLALFFNLLFPFSGMAASELVSVPIQIIPGKGNVEFIITPVTRIVVTDKRLMNAAGELQGGSFVERMYQFVGFNERGD